MSTSLTLDVAGLEWADSVKSFLKCPSCGTRFPFSDELVLLNPSLALFNNGVTCESCGFICYGPLECGIDVASDCLDLTGPAWRKACYERDWFHYTTDPDWLSHVRKADIWVHAGTEASALALAKYRHYEADNCDIRYVFRLRISGRTRISPHVTFDRNDWPEYLQDKYVNDIHMNDRNMIRYVNAFESPGQVSILIDPAMLRVTECWKINRFADYL